MSDVNSSENGWREFLAKWLSRVFHPFVLSVIALGLSVYLETGSWAQAAMWSPICLAAFLLPGCVHQQDLDEWRGQPVSKLDKHPFFLTVPQTRTIASDGTEIRDYVNGGNVSTCSGFATAGLGMADCSTTLAPATTCSTSRMELLNATHR